MPNYLRELRIVSTKFILHSERSNITQSGANLDIIREHGSRTCLVLLPLSHGAPFVHHRTGDVLIAGTCDAIFVVPHLR